jgi:hypothetical protein
MLPAHIDDLLQRAAEGRWLSRQEGLLLYRAGRECGLAAARETYQRMSERDLHHLIRDVSYMPVKRNTATTS